MSERISNPSEAAMRLAHDIICHFDAVDIRDAARLIDAHDAELKQHFRAALAQARQVAANSSASAEGVVRMLTEAMGEHYNAGVKCDTNEGPCVCGTWHDERDRPAPAASHCDYCGTKLKNGKCPMQDFHDAPGQPNCAAPAASPDVAMDAVEALDEQDLIRHKYDVVKQWRAETARKVRDIIHEKAVKPLKEQLTGVRRNRDSLERQLAALREKIERLKDIGAGTGALGHQMMLERDTARAELAALRAQPPAPDFYDAVEEAAAKCRQHNEAHVLSIANAMRPAFAAAEKRAAKECMDLICSVLGDSSFRRQMFDVIHRRFGIEEQP